MKWVKKIDCVTRRVRRSGWNASEQAGSETALAVIYDTDDGDAVTVSHSSELHEMLDPAILVRGLRRLADEVEARYLANRATEAK